MDFLSKFVEFCRDFMDIRVYADRQSTVIRADRGSYIDKKQIKGWVVRIMLELIRTNIHMNRWKRDAAVQITLDDDFIVPDTMDDVAQVVMEAGDIQIESVKNAGEKVTVKGKLMFSVLYRREEGGLQTLAGQISFEEPVNVPELTERDALSASWELEDLSTGLINSRKLSVKAIVTLKVRVETLTDAEAAVDVVTDGTGAVPEVKKYQTDVAAIAVRRKDTYRIKEELSLTGSKPGIDHILWSEIKLRGESAKPLDGRVHVEGSLVVFVIYEGEGDNTLTQWLEETVPFAGDVELAESVEDMVPSISIRLIHRALEAKPDYDGEMRQLELDAVLELDMKLYEEKALELVSDLYATDREVTLQAGEAGFDRLLTRNIGKCRVAEKIDIGNGGRVLQICHYDAAVRIDEVQVKDGVVTVNGILDVFLLYMTPDDLEPVKSVTEPVPFEYAAEAEGAGEDSVCQLNAGLEQLTAVMTGSGSVEIKAVLSLDLLVLQPVRETVIESVTEAPLDLEKLQAMPGIVGYIVQPGDTLWEIAKRFRTTSAEVRKMSGLDKEEVQAGDRLILVKEVAEPV